MEYSDHPRTPSSLAREGIRRSVGCPSTWSSTPLDMEYLETCLYLDESVFCLWMPVEYSCFFRGEQKRLEQTKRRGKRVSILGLFKPLMSFVYGLVVGSFDGDRYITMIEDQARQSKQHLDKTGRIRVIVQDNGSVHTSQKVKAKWADWEAQGLYFFFLPKYCSKWN